jgi:hypothetical protein
MRQYEVFAEAKPGPIKTTRAMHDIYARLASSRWLQDIDEPQSRGYKILLARLS